MIWIGLVVLQALGGQGMARAKEPTQVVRLNLEKCVQIGLENATSILKGKNDLELSGTTVVQGYAQFLPSLDVGANYSYINGKTLLTFSGASLLDSSSNNFGWNLSSRLNIFNGFSDYAGLKSALSKREFASSSLRWAQQQVALDINQTYLQVVLDRFLREIAQKNLAASQARLKLLEGQAQVGSAAIADLYRQQAQTSSDELSLRNVQVRLKDDEVLLVRKLRVDPEQTYEFETPVLKEEKSSLARQPVQSLITTALQSRDDAKMQKAKAEFTDWDLSQAKSPFLPRLDLFFDRTSAGHYLLHQFVNGTDVLPTTQQPLFSQVGNQTLYTVTLGVTWNLFNRFLTKLDVDKAKTTHENAKIDQEDSLLQIQADVRTAYQDYQVAIDQLSTSKVGAKAAQQAYDAIAGKFRVGSASFIDLLTSQSALVQAQSNEAQALVNLTLRQRVLEYVVGDLSVRY